MKTARKEFVSEPKSLPSSSSSPARQPESASLLARRYRVNTVTMTTTVTRELLHVIPLDRHPQNPKIPTYFLGMDVGLAIDEIAFEIRGEETNANMIR